MVRDPDHSFLEGERSPLTDFEIGLKRRLGPRVAFHHTVVLAGEIHGRSVTHAGDSQIGLHRTSKGAERKTKRKYGADFLTRGAKTRIGELRPGQEYYVWGFSDTVRGNRGDVKDRGLFIHGNTDAAKHR